MTKNIADRLFGSTKDAFSVRNVVMKILFVLFFGILLSLRTLVRNVDEVGKNGGSALDYMFAFGSSVREGVFLSLASIWDLLLNASTYLQESAYGKIVIGILMAFFVIGFIYQFVSMLINIFDLHGKNDAGNEDGRAVGFIINLAVTILVIIILSAVTFYSGMADPLWVETPEEGGDNSSNVYYNETIAGDSDEVVQIDMRFDTNGT